MSNSSVVKTGFQSTPPAIRHFGNLPERPDIQDIVTQACHAIHITERARLLLLLYADCSEWFAPAEAFIEERTGIPSNKIYLFRRELVDCGMIAYDQKKHEIKIDWNHIRLFSTLDPQQTSCSRKHSYFAPACSGAPAEKPMGACRLNISPVDGFPRRKLTAAQKCFYDTVEAMTPSEWNNLMRGIGIDIPPEDESMIAELDCVKGWREGVDTTVTWADLGIDEHCPTRGPIIFDNPLPF